MRLFPIVLACALLGAAPAASAAPANYDCPADAYGCLFDGKDGTGDRYVVRECGKPVKLPPGWENKVDSARVQGWQLTLLNYVSGGPHKEVLRGSRGQNVNAWEPNLADIIDCWW